MEIRRRMYIDDKRCGGRAYRIDQNVGYQIAYEKMYLGNWGVVLVEEVCYGV